MKSDHGDVTLMFISSIGMYYEERSSDPIFYANRPVGSIGVNNRTYWYRNNPYASVLACVDNYFICKTDIEKCWSAQSIADHFPDEYDDWSRVDKDTFFLLVLGLRNANAYSSVRMRKADALTVSKLHDDILSPAIPHDHWKTEVAKIFRTALARARVEILSNINGYYAHEPGFVNKLSPRWNGMCSLVIVNARGYKSVSLWGLVLILGLSITVMVCSISINGELVVINTLVTISKILWNRSCQALVWIRKTCHVLLKLGKSSWDSLYAWIARIRATTAGYGQIQL